MTFTKNLGARIQELRKDKGLTQDALAELAKMESTNLSKIENGHKWLASRTLESIARALEVEPHELFNFNNTKPKPKIKTKKELIKTIEYLLSTSTQKEIEFFYKVLTEYREIHK